MLKKSNKNFSVKFYYKAGIIPKTRVSRSWQISSYVYCSLYYQLLWKSIFGAKILLKLIWREDWMEDFFNKLNENRKYDSMKIYVAGKYDIKHSRIFEEINK